MQSFFRFIKEKNIYMNKLLRVVILFSVISVSSTLYSQCIIDTTNTTSGFTPATPAVIQPGIAYSQTVQVFVPTSYNVYTVDSLHIDSLNGQPAGINYQFNPPSGTVLGGHGGAICFSGTTSDTVGPYPLTFYGAIHTNAGLIPFSYLVTVAPTFGYKFRVETAPVASFTVDSPICSTSDSVRFVDHTSGYPTRWTWAFAGGSPATSTRQFPVVAYDSAGTYTVSFIARNGISSDTITRSITVNPSVSGSVTSSPALDGVSATGGAVVIASGGTLPFSYDWSNGATTDSLSGLVHGIYAISITDAKGCRYINDSVIVSFTNGIGQMSNCSIINIYPNPAGDDLNVIWTQKSKAEIAILDLSGKVMQVYLSNGSVKNTFNVHNLIPGDYIIRITDTVTHKQQSVMFNKL